MTDHAAAGPSSSTMWMQCPASITLAAGRTRPPSVYAMEGTAAHTIAEMIIRGELFPPRKIVVEGKEFIIDTPMYRALRSYVDFAFRIINDADEWHCEKRVGIQWPYFRDLVWGTTDFAARTDTHLDIVDLKYGQGVLVSPDSAQLKIYAIAAYHTLWPDDLIETVSLTIVQPRVDARPKTHTMTGEELGVWAEEQLRPAMHRIVRNDHTEVAGSWCRWCVRKSECKAFANHKNSVAAEIFDDGIDFTDQ